MSARRKRWVLALGLGACIALMVARGDRAPRLLLNTTASAPVGFYWVTPGRYAVGDLVAVRPPRWLADWMARRGYLPVNVPLLKVIAAGRGRHVCGRRDGLFLDARRLAIAKSHDRWGRPLPRFRGCRVLTEGEIMLVNAHAPESLDGRYFGPIPARGVIGRARPIWTWAAHS